TSTKAAGYVWIESGYTWLLWGGGIPLLASYVWFVGSVLRKGWAYARRADAAGIAATAVTTAVCSQVVLMLIDPPLTYPRAPPARRGRGAARFWVRAPGDRGGGGCGRGRGRGRPRRARCSRPPPGGGAPMPPPRETPRATNPRPAVKGPPGSTLTDQDWLV